MKKNMNMNMSMMIVPLTISALAGAGTLAFCAYKKKHPVKASKLMNDTKEMIKDLK